MSSEVYDIAFADEAEGEDLSLSDFTVERRDYQLTAKLAVTDGWGGHRKQLLDMATGTGKTTVFGMVAKDEVDKGGRVLVLAHRDKLVFQAAGRIAGEMRLEVGVEKAGNHAALTDPVVVASIQSMTPERLARWPRDHFSLVVADESHHTLATSWMRVLNHFDGHAKVLGVTATPDLAGRRQLGEYYEKVAYRYQITQAVRDGWLVPLVMKSIPLEIDLRGLRPGRTANGSDFTDGQLHDRMVPVIDALAKQICTLAFNRKTIAFVPTIECSELLANGVNRYGLKGIFVSGDTERGHDERTTDFINSGSGTVLCNAALYAEGADFPDVDCIVFGRCTRSRKFYAQQAGRGTRTLPGVTSGQDGPLLRKRAIAQSAKPDCLLLDPLWISDRLDLCQPYDLVTTKPEVRARMEAMAGQDDLVGMEEMATRDMIEALATEARKQARKEARTIDPLTWAAIVGDEDLATWEPETAFESKPPTPDQMKWLAGQHIDTSKVRFYGQASLLMSRMLARYRFKLATAKQIEFLRVLGVPRKSAANLNQKEASEMIARQKKKLGWK